MVQSEFLFHLEIDDRQNSFDASVVLMLEVFPHRGKSRVIEKDWARGRKYIGQVFSILESYSKALGETVPLLSSKNLLELICNAAW